MNTKQVIVVRKDLKMRKGKMIAQGAHASMKAVFDTAGIKHPESDVLIVPYPPELREWFLDKFTKIAVSVDSEKELIDIYEQAKMAGLMCSLVQDAGLTEFDGVPTFTAVAVGPAKVEDVDAITGELKLL